MADAKLTALTQNTTPALTDIIYMVDDPGGVPLSQKITIQDLRNGYCLPAHGATFSPADGTTYYFGSLYSAAPNTTAAWSWIPVPRAGIVTAVQVWVRVAGTLASAETSTMSLRLNNTTDYTIDSNVVATAVYQGFANSAMSVVVSVGSALEIKWVTPSWATNPTNVLLSAFIYIT